MRKYFVFALFLLTLCHPSFSQVKAASDSSAVQAPPSHVIFRHLEVDGPLDSFVSRLSAGGFSYLGTRDGTALLQGTFAGVEDATVRVFSSFGSVWRVVVDFPALETWPSVKKQYLFFKKSYSLKYGGVPVSSEKFPSYIPEGTGREWHAFKEESAEYSSLFSVPNGRVCVSVLPVLAGSGRFYVRLEYVDELNSMFRENAVMDDI